MNVNYFTDDQLFRCQHTVGEQILGGYMLIGYVSDERYVAVAEVLCEFIG